MHSSSELASARVLLMGLWVKLKAQRADNLGARLPKHTLEWLKRAYDFLEFRTGLEQETNKEGAEQNFCSSTLRFGTQITCKCSLELAETSGFVQEITRLPDWRCPSILLCRRPSLFGRGTNCAA